MQRGNQNLHLYDCTDQYTLMTLATMIDEAKQGSQAAEQLLFEELSPRAKMLCLRCIKNNEDAGEIMLDGFFKFLKVLTVFSYESESGVYGFVKKIMVNECLMQLRKSHSFTISSAETSMPEIAIADEVCAKLHSMEIYQLVLKLPTGYRTVFNLFVIEGYDHREISRALHITESASLSQLPHAK